MMVLIQVEGILPVPDTYLHIFRHGLLPQKFGFALLDDAMCPALPALRDVELSATEAG